MVEERKTTILVPDVCCAVEETAVRNAFQTVEGIQHLDIDLTNRTVSVRHSGETRVLLDTLQRAGFPGRVMSHEHRSASGVSARVRWSVAASLLLLSAGLVLSWIGSLPEVTPVLFLLSMLSGGWEIALRGFRALRALRLDVNVLMTVAAIGAVILGEYAEGAAVLSLYALSLLLEAMSIDRTRRAIGGLMALSPTVAQVRTADGERTTQVRDIGIGATVIVRPGERIPLDGTVSHGETTVDESALTGESLPVYKGAASAVYAGSLNGQGAMEVVVSAASEGTVLHSITEMVEAARRKKDSVQTFMERFAAWYVPAVFGLAVLVAIIPPLITGQGFSDWFYRSLTLLVISCPCSLLLSTPMAVVSAITAAAKQGILIKNGEVLERLSQVRAVAIDKTGTITHGFHDVTSVQPLTSMSPERIVSIAAALESRSEHPLARAILRHARSNGVVADLRIDAFLAVPGKGVTGTIGGDTYLIGNHAYIEDHGICSPRLEERISAMERDGATVLILADDRQPLGLIAARDTARSDAGRAIDAIRRVTRSPVSILTGDNQTVGSALGRALGIDTVLAGLLPEDKTKEVARLTEKLGPVAMVGDGINDAPALAVAHVGIAIGGTGSDAAIDAADVVLLSPSLSHIAPLLALGKAAHRTIRFNIGISLATKAVFLLLGIAGLSSLWLAILADDGITLLVLLNSLRLLRFRHTNPTSGS